MPSEKSGLLQTYDSCLNNAIELIADAEYLMERGSHPRAYALAFTAIEEIVKSQLVADLYTGKITRQEFDDAFRDHRRKIKRSSWISSWARCGFSSLPSSAMPPSFDKRMASLYVDLGTDLSPVQPASAVSAHEAEELIRFGCAGLEKIRLWEEQGLQIGTKGFMK